MFMNSFNIFNATEKRIKRFFDKIIREKALSAIF